MCTTSPWWAGSDRPARKLTLARFLRSELKAAAAQVPIERPRELSKAHKALLAQAYVMLPAMIRRYRHTLQAAGMEADEALHELVVVFSSRLMGAHPWDPSKGTLECYLFLLTKSVLSNRATKRTRRAKGMAALALAHRGRVGEIDLESLFPELVPERRGNPPPST